MTLARSLACLPFIVGEAALAEPLQCVMLTACDEEAECEELNFGLGLGFQLQGQAVGDQVIMGSAVAEVQAATTVEFPPATALMLNWPPLQTALFMLKRDNSFALSIVSQAPGAGRSFVTGTCEPVQ